MTSNNIHKNTKVTHFVFKADLQIEVTKNS